MTDPDRVVVRSWIGAADGGYDPQKMAAQVTGDLAVDWDVDREVVSAEPFGSYLVHDAVALAGRAETLVDLVRRWETFLVDGYDTFGECWTWGTPVHGWSASPTRDLVALFSASHRSSPASPEPGSRRDPDRCVRSPGRCQPRMA
jgi:alpha-L-rhamnosidase